MTEDDVDTKKYAIATLAYDTTGNGEAFLEIPQCAIDRLKWDNSTVLNLEVTPFGVKITKQESATVDSLNWVEP